MISLRRSFAIGLFLLIALVVAACGSSTASSSPTPTATTSSGPPLPTVTISIPVPTTGTSGAVVKTATASVNGTLETILTDAAGKTLYYRTSDSPPGNVCSGPCAAAWPPLLVTGTPTSSTSLSGKLTAVQTANGNQVEYNGHPLYTYAADSAPGQTTGEGAAGVWHVATPSLT